jgi:hypothetical protein
MKTDKLRWLKFIDDNLTTKPKRFWKYILKLKKNNHVVTQIKIGEYIITQPQCIVEAFADHFPSILFPPCSVVIPINARFSFSDSLNVPSISDYAYVVEQTIRSLSPSMCVSPDKILSSIVKGCSEICSLLLSHIFNISFYKGIFLLCGSKRPSCLFSRKITII